MAFIIKDVRKKLLEHRKKTYRTGVLPDNITIHHSATETGNSSAFAAYHVNNHQWPGVGYHYIILKNGVVERCWDDHTVSYHTRGLNTGNIGICLVGNGSFTTSQKSSLIKLIQILLKKYGMDISKVKGHRERRGQTTRCPGFDAGVIRDKLRNDLNSPLLKIGSKGGEVKRMQKILARNVQLSKYGADGIFGLETEKAVKEFQKQRKLTADGIVGVKTWKELLKERKK
ncbi:peptidoglycan recognition protein family protein [Alkalicoccus halolimnae]|uniref:Autolysin n=1 Tax=Alkalicoccus halolimnae TaxID=1667239 RepID=A0A5C7FB16_9BACI|nr:N-acetylmuramoyl-L-alanine amidase [Alkalicoccus halolimnae]TXF86618.1 N-acetylmuramoyl-L-alanine amidase [Alkalicoccus halolimnae]